MIKEIYKTSYMRGQFAYVGTLRNAKKFSINENIFYAYGQRIIKGVICGVELPPDENPEYRYKVMLPEEIVRESVRKHEDNPDWYSVDYEIPKTLILTCDRVFKSIQEARESAEKNLQNLYELEKKEIESYFNQFLKK